MSPYLMDFLEISTNGRYHRDMKILKILAFISKRFRVYGIFKKLQIDDYKGGGVHQIQQFFRQHLLKITSGLKNSAGYFSFFKKLKNDIKIALKPTGIKL